MGKKPNTKETGATLVLNGRSKIPFVAGSCLYLQLIKGKNIYKTKGIAPNIMIDYAKDNTVIGIEVIL